MTSNSELGRMLSAATEDLDRIRTVLRERLEAMADAMNGWPRSSWIGEGGGRANVSFCEEHGKERCECGSGTTYAARSDRTGETAMLTDRAANHRRDLERALASIQRQARWAFDIVEQYGTRSATPEERSATSAANERDESCWSCARTSVSLGVTRWEPAVRSAEVQGVRRQLCWWCFDWIRKGDGSAPTATQVDQHHRGIPVRRPA